MNIKKVKDEYSTQIIGAFLGILFFVVLIVGLTTNTSNQYREGVVRANGMQYITVCKLLQEIETTVTMNLVMNKNADEEVVRQNIMRNMKIEIMEVGRDKDFTEGFYNRLVERLEECR